MRKERLERIIRESKGVVWNTETDEDLLTELDTPDFNWLIEQVELYDEMRQDAISLYKQNKRYREAIDQIGLQVLFDPVLDNAIENVAEIILALESESE